MKYGEYGIDGCAFPALLPEEMGVREGYFDAGMTKREHAAIDLRVPDSGDEHIDAMIRKANRRDAAVAAMQGLLGSPDYPHGFEALADDAVRQADALLARMEEVNPKKRPIDNHTGQQYEWCGCGRWVIHGTSHPTLTSCNCGAWYKPHVAREEKP